MCYPIFNVKYSFIMKMSNVYKIRENSYVNVCELITRFQLLPIHVSSTLSQDYFEANLMYYFIHKYFTIYL